MPLTSTCGRCGDRLTFTSERGWVHAEGGTYVMRCDSCGWQGAPWPSPRACPSCGDQHVRDDHCVQVQATR
jgi:primosomal protein N'